MSLPNHINIKLKSMKLSTNYSELSELLREKTNKDINLEYGGNAETVLVKYMHVPCYIRIEKVDVPFVALSYNVGSESLSPDIMVDPCPPMPFFIGGLFRRGAQALGNRAIGALIEHFVEHPAVSINEDKILNVDLDKIPQLSKVMEMVTIDNISFNENGVTVELTVKMTEEI